jgi:hypothetical protein
VSNKQKSSRRYTKYFSDISKTAAWTALSYPARLLYLELQRQFIETANNNGKVFLSTRDAAERLGASQRWVCIWYRELEHYGFIVQTQPGAIGPNGRAALWRLTDHAHGWLDGKPIQATKDYLKWDGTPFRKSATKKRKPNGTSVQIATESTHYDDQKYSYASTKSTHRDPQKSEISYDDQKYSYLKTSPYSAPAERGVEAAEEAAPFGIGHNAGPPLNTPVDLPELVDDLSIPAFLRRQ